jgi:hypothetical protein
LHAALINAGDKRVGAHLNAQFFQLILRALGQLRRVGRQYARRAIHQDHTRLRGVEPPKIARHGAVRNLSERTRQLNPRRPRADHHKRSQHFALVCVLFALSTLERHQHAVPDLERVVNRLQAGRHALPLVVAEVAVRSARGDNQVVVLNVPVRVAVGDHHLLVRHIHRLRVRQQHLGIFLLAQDLPDRRRDIRRSQRRRRHLVQQRLKQVVVAPVKHRDPHRRAVQLARGVDAAETGAENHDSRVLRHAPSTGVTSLIAVLCRGFICSKERPE